MSTTLIVGCGYLGRRVGRLLADRGERVFGTTRTGAKAEELARMAIEPVIVDVLNPSTIRLPVADRVLYCVGFDRGAGVPMRMVYVDGLRNVLSRLPASPGRFAYASSTGVYGRDDGGWVDEDSPAEPRHDPGKVCLEGEETARAQGTAIVLRFSGLYGPGRIPRKSAIGHGEPIVGDPRKFLNVIQIDDAATATVAALDRGEPGRIYLATDDRPVERREFYARVAEGLGAPAPRFLPPEPGSPEARREESNKRASNRRLRGELAVSLAYPDIATGIPASLAAENAGDGPGLA